MSKDNKLEDYKIGDEFHVKFKVIGVVNNAISAIPLRWQHNNKEGQYVKHFYSGDVETFFNVKKKFTKFEVGQVFHRPDGYKMTILFIDEDEKIMLAKTNIGRPIAFTITKEIIQQVEKGVWRLIHD